VEIMRAAVSLLLKSMALSARSAGQQRLLWLQQAAGVGAEAGELATLG
jgi:hypothetical protein